MLSHLVDVSIRSLIVAIAAFAFLGIAGRRRTAALQHAAWATVVCGMLALFAFGGVLPRLPLRILNAPAIATHSTRSGPASLPVFDNYLPDRTSAVTPVNRQRSLQWQDFVLYGYFAITLALLGRLAIGVFAARTLFSTAHLTSIGDGNVYESSAIAVPVALGPKILLPHDWRDWDSAKLSAVLAHEGAHVRRCDGPVAALAGLNRCLFWFHPLAWFLEHRLALLADQACDDSCIAELGDPDGYARLLLEMASAVGAGQGRVRSPLLTMAAASHIRRRIDALLDERRTFSRGLSRKAGASVLLCALPLVVLAGVTKLDRRSAPLSIELTPPAAPAAPPLFESRRAPLQIAQAQTPETSAPQPVSTPKFDDVSVKPCATGDATGHGVPGGRGGEGGRGIGPAPAGEIFIHCLSVFEILGYIADFGGLKLLNDPHSLNEPERVRGGPPWISTGLWTIDAKTTDPVASQWIFSPASPAAKKVNGPMLMAMLEEKFGLQTHRIIDEVPMYSLTLAPGGPRLQPAEEGGCVPYSPGDPVLVKDMFPAGQKPLCIQHTGWVGPNWTIDAAGTPMGQLAAALAGVIVDRPVLDKTGVIGKFNYHLKFAHDQSASGRFPAVMPIPFTAPTADDPLAPTLNSVLEQQLGLTLVSDKGPREFIVIDSAQQPQ